MNKTTSLEIELPDETYSALKQAAARVHKTEAELARDLLQTSLRNQTSLLGLFAEEPALVESMLADIMHSREVTPVRLAEDDNG